MVRSKKKKKRIDRVHIYTVEIQTKSNKTNIPISMRSLCVCVCDHMRSRTFFHFHSDRIEFNSYTANPLLSCTTHTDNARLCGTTAQHTLTKGKVHAVHVCCGDAIRFIKPVNLYTQHTAPSKTPGEQSVHPHGGGPCVRYIYIYYDASFFSV